ncbi:helix-turn-helix domain-containing protein [Modestobacter roseus]|uniref:helix-turn-helix domain-containing protein n=1 Tax=Modestobacter roseus TaxID=1181884 RepID=UPI001294F8B1|nr:helix-turn-helix transcriptional regulator [Modestobacter roseus]MQA35804.1 helix-turn-helix domain-containing protein [Modestobacter roseus]
MPVFKTSRHVVLSEERRRTLASRASAARKAAGLTQETLAHQAGVSAEHIRRIERGAGNPSLATLYALTDAMGIPLADLVPD